MTGTIPPPVKNILGAAKLHDSLDLPSVPIATEAPVMMGGPTHARERDGGGLGQRCVCALGLSYIPGEREARGLVRTATKRVPGRCNVQAGSQPRALIRGLFLEGVIIVRNAPPGMPPGDAPIVLF